MLLEFFTVVTRKVAQPIQSAEAFCLVSALGFADPGLIHLGEGVGAETREDPARPSFGRFRIEILISIPHPPAPREASGGGARARRVEPAYFGSGILYRYPVATVARSGKLMDVSAIKGQLALSRPTLETYINALQTLFLVERVLESEERQ